MEQRLSLITLGVSDLARSRAFYESLGWQASSASQGDVVFFQANGLGLALFPRELLAKDAGVADSAPGFSGLTLAQNLRSEAEVDALFARMVASGAQALKRPEKAFWGGYTSYVADPDGHVWELAWNPFFALDASGNLHLPDSRS